MGEPGGKLSEYERERLKRIEENRKMLDELFPEGTGLHVSVERRRVSRRNSESSNSQDSDDSSEFSASPVARRVRPRLDGRDA